MSDAGSLTSAAAAGTTDFTPTHTYPARCLFTIELDGATAPPPCVVPLADSDLIHLTSGRLTAVVDNLRVTLPRIPGLDAEIIIAVVPASWPSSSLNELTAPRLVGGELIVIAATNTAIVAEERLLKFQPGISRSLLGITPGMHAPALAVHFRIPPGGKTGTEGTYNCYLAADITVGGFGTVIPQ